MPDPATWLTAIKDAGGWVTAVGIAGIAGWLLYRAVVTGALVPGSIHARALDQVDTLSATLTRITASVDALASQTASSLKELRDDVAELRRTGWSPRRD